MQKGFLNLYITPKVIILEIAESEIFK